MTHRARFDPSALRGCHDPAAARVRSGLGRLNQHAANLVDAAHSVVTGGEDLTGTATAIDADLQVFQESLPHIMKTLGMIENLEESIETVAETMEPLQGSRARPAEWRIDSPRAEGLT